ncbi:hypothetical protein AURDEDRAFT_131686, partial [Auricularia subglabra TFB-10046 SS5]
MPETHMLVEATPTPSRTPTPAPEQPSPEKIAREANRKRKADTTADKEAERAREIRAIVRCTDNRHLREAITPIHEADVALPTSDFHVANWAADSAPCAITSLPVGALPGATLTLEEAVCFCENGAAWLAILHEANKNDTSTKGYACLANVLNWRFDEHQVGVVRELVEEALRRYCKMRCITMLAPQRTKDDHECNKAGLHSFLVRFISYECAIDLASKDAHHFSWDENPDGISLEILLPDLAPPTHVGTYDNLQNFPTITKSIRDDILVKVRAHIKENWEPIKQFIVLNKASIWGGGSIEPWCLELVQASTRIHVWEGKDRNGRPEATLSIYFLGVFDTAWLHEEWARILLGDVLDLDEYGKITRRTGSNVYTCTICYHHDHHAKICGIWYHPSWPEELRRRREQQIKALQQQRRNEQGGFGRGGANPGRGGGPSSYYGGPSGFNGAGPSGYNGAGPSNYNGAGPSNQHGGPRGGSPFGGQGRGQRTAARTGFSHPNSPNPYPVAHAVIDANDTSTPIDEDEQSRQRQPETPSETSVGDPGPRGRSLAPQEDADYAEAHSDSESEYAPDDGRSSSPCEPAELPSSTRRPRKRKKKRKQNTHRSMLRLPKAKSKTGLKTKAHLLVGSQNMKGRGAEDVRRSQKWIDLNAHIYLKRGVGVVLNKKLVQTKEARSWEIIPGRALVVSLDWHGNNRLTILAVYAPNAATENKAFWHKIGEILKKKAHIPRPKIVLGDCNATEAHIDRFPLHINDSDMSVELLELQSYLGVQDGWRKTNPGKTSFTWRSADQSKHSRIDRIFVNRELAAGCRNWKIWNEGFCAGTDHSAVMVEIVDLNMPFVGESRSTMRPAYMGIKPLMADVVRRGIELEDELDTLLLQERQPGNNVQTKWPIFKAENMRRAKEESREIGRKEMRLLAVLAKEKETIIQKASDSELDAEDVPFELQQLDARTEEITKRQRKRHRQNARVKSRMLKETNCSWWFNQGKETSVRELIPELRKTSADGDPVYTQKMEEMADEAREHHDTLQTKDIHPDAGEREAAIRTTLSHMTRILDEVDMGELANLVTEEAVRWALGEAAYRKAAGKDGHIYEFWCKLDEMYRAAKDKGARGFNIVRVLTILFQDIQQHGLVEGSTFAEGW